MKWDEILLDELNNSLISIIKRQVEKNRCTDREADKLNC